MSAGPISDRRHFLKSAATLIALPSLEAFATPTPTAKRARNFVAIGTYLGWHQNTFFPKNSGALTDLPPTLAPLAKHRDQFTVFSGLDHRAPNGHKAWSNFLCGHQPKSYSLDQQIADQLGQKSRFHSLQLTAGSGEPSGTKAISFTKQGIPLPMIARPSVLYGKLFASPEDRKRSEYLLTSGRSALDTVVSDAARLNKSLPQSDRDKLDEYFTSVRGVEKRMARQIENVNEAVPTPDYQLPPYDPITPNLQIEAEEILYDLIVLALESQSTRVASLFLDGLGQVFSLDGRALGSGYHGLSHHGNDPNMIRDLVAIETAHIHCLSGFLQQLSEKKTVTGKSLLDDTIVLVGTGMGDASRHSNQNLPTLVAGGGFTHGQHLAITRDQKDAPLLGDLYLTLQQRLGLEVENFSNARRNLNHLFS